jgi:hypothetical protein
MARFQLLSHCGTEARGSFPAAFCGPLQYGAGIKAYALNLLIAQMLSLIDATIVLPVFCIALLATSDLPP